MSGSRFRRGATAVASLAVVVAGASVPVVVTPASAVEPARRACEWAPDVLPLPEHAFYGRVTAGAGEWLAGVAGVDGSNEAVRWHDGEVEALGPAFGLDTTVTAVNEDGVVVGTATDQEGAQHAFRHQDGHYERLPSSGGWSTALDINARGDVVGHDGSRLVVWPATGPPRFLDMPPGEAPYGRAAIDDDGTVATRTGHVARGALRWRAYAWTPAGGRVSLPPADVRDLRHGRIVGTTGDPAAVTVAASWSTDRDPRPYFGGTAAVALNDEGVVVGEGRNGEPLAWTGVLPTSLPTPANHTPGSVTAVNTTEAAGFAYPEHGDGAAPVRWHCR